MLNTEEITKAIAAHGMWKQRLRKAIEEGNSEYTVDKLKVDNLCDFGKWLHSLSSEEKKSTHWPTIQQLHAKFHIEAAHILDLAIKGKIKEAEEAMAIGKNFTMLSGELTSAMMKWKNSLT